MRSIISKEEIHHRFLSYVTFLLILITGRESWHHVLMYCKIHLKRCYSVYLLPIQWNPKILVPVKSVTKIPLISVQSGFCLESFTVGSIVPCLKAVLKGLPLFCEHREITSIEVGWILLWEFVPVHTPFVRGTLSFCRNCWSIKIPMLL